MQYILFVEQFQSNNPETVLLPHKTGEYLGKLQNSFSWVRTPGIDISNLLFNLRTCIYERNSRHLKQFS